METKLGDTNDLLNFQIHRHTNRLSRTLLSWLEDRIMENPGMFTEEQAGYMRKRILDINGDFLRELTSELGNFRVDLNFNKNDN